VETPVEKYSGNFESRKRKRQITYVMEYRMLNLWQTVRDSKRQLYTWTALNLCCCRTL